ncbi:MAG: maleylpyruvate isomerase N-terminal domain-containing protein [Acidimicrobiales bacterium]
MTAIPDRSDTDHISLFTEERQALLALLGGLGTDDWTRPTACPGWSVLDLSCHLLGADLGLLARQRDAHFGTTPPVDSIGDEAAFTTWLDALQDAWVGATRRLSPRIVVDLLGWTGPQVVELLSAQDPAERAATVSWASSDLVPRWLDHARELSEQWIHRQQLEDAVGRPADLSCRTASAVLDALRWAYPYRLSAFSAPDGDTVDITVTGPIERRWLLQYCDLAWRFVDDAGSHVVARANMSATEAWRLLTNNLPEAEQRCLDITGDPIVVEIVLKARAIIGAAN